MAKKGGLGKGLDALFLDNEAEVSSTLMTLRLSDIEPNKEQPRRTFQPEALAELSDSIAEHGVLQPIVVRALPGGAYQIIAGERRWRASRQAGLGEIPAIVIEADDDKVRELALIENLQRQDLTPLEEAMGYRSLMDATGMTQEQAAKRLGKSRPVIANALRLLTLPEDVKARLSEGRLTAGHARMLAGVEDAAEASALAAKVEAEGLSVRELEQLLRKNRGAATGRSPEEKPKAEKKPEAPFGDKLSREMQISLQEATGRRIKIERSGEGGTLQIEFFSEADLKELAEKLNK